ncbi:protein EXORDIUM-like 2 [Ananas comosus]|uniref:Protein EXORDIUM-like 2 n=1 Tax=Ananas comosus TaxID=4615 RepID=A0A6P5FC96_ANACO|nr:protein EXORDIUM-like 2 [Ananas comosus]
MDAPPHPVVLSLFLILSLLALRSGAVNPRELFLVKPEPIVLTDHNGTLLTGNITVNLLWYGPFSPAQRAIVSDFVRSLSSSPNPDPSPSVADWWRTTSLYGGGGARVSLGREILDERLSRGGSLSGADLLALAARAAPHRGAVAAVLTAPGVGVEGFCVSRCGHHGAARGGRHCRARYAYIWAGNPAAQCPGECAWPFQRPVYGPQTPPLVPPNGDAGVDGLIINLAALLAGAVTDPFGDGYYQGPGPAGPEAATACTGIFGSGAYPGYPGKLLVDPTTGASYNAVGLAGRKYLLPALWDPRTSQCTPLV